MSGRKDSNLQTASLPPSAPSTRPPSHKRRAVRLAAGHKFSPAGAAFCVAWLMTITFTFFAGWFFYRLVEGPCERWRRRHYSNQPATASV